MKNQVKNEKIVQNTHRIYVTTEETDFQIGDKYTYYYQKEEQTLIIQKSETGNTVSKKRSGKKEKPLIDIRNQSALKAFQDYEQLKIEVLADKILVTGYRKKKTARVISFLKTKACYEARQEIAFQLALDISMADQVANGDASVAQAVSRFGLPSDISLALKVVSLFSGAGFSDYGLIQARHPQFSFELTQAYDYDPYACETYAHNLGSHIQLEDLTKLNLQTIPSADVMLCTPSCFGFSKINRSGNVDRKKEQNDLTKIAVDAIKQNPTCKVFVIENAPELLTHEKGTYLKHILEELNEFEISYGVLNAVHFGAPQHRKRAFLIGSKIGKIELPDATYRNRAFKTAGQALLGLREAREGSIPNLNDYTQSGELVQRRMSFIPCGGNVKDIPEAIRPKAQMSNAYRRLDPQQPSISIVNFRKSLISPPYPNVNRTLTVREACRLQGIPDTYEIKGTLNAMQQQVCNGVVPAVMTAIGHQILSAFARLLEKPIVIQG